MNIRKKKCDWPSEQELAEAARQVSEAMLQNLSEPEEGEHEFSPEFEAKMKILIESESAKPKPCRIVVTALKYAVSFILLLILGYGTFLAVNTKVEAGQDFSDWLGKVFEKSVLYEFLGEKTEEHVPAYRMGWVPEEYVRYKESDGKNYYSLWLKKRDDPEVNLVFDFYFMRDGLVDEIFTDGYQLTSVTVNGLSADLYCAEDETLPSILVWMDEAERVYFKITGHLNSNDMLHMAESVFLDISTK